MYERDTHPRECHQGNGTSYHRVLDGTGQESQDMGPLPDLMSCLTMCQWDDEMCLGNALPSMFGLQISALGLSRSLSSTRWK